MAPQQQQHGRRWRKIIVLMILLLLMNAFISFPYHSIQRKIAIEILKIINDVLQWTEPWSMFGPFQHRHSNDNNSTASSNPIQVIVLQGRDNFQPNTTTTTTTTTTSVHNNNNALYSRPDLFQPIFYKPKPNSQRPWHCHLLQIYAELLDDVFEKQKLPFVIIVEDDIIVLPDHIQPLYHQVQKVIHAAPPFYSFYTSGKKKKKKQQQQNQKRLRAASYRHGTTFFYMRRSFYKYSLKPACLLQPQPCVDPIDLCMAKNFLLGQSTQDYVLHPNNNRFVPKELQHTKRRRLLLFY